MTASSVTDWRRWIAMLCIALFAFVMIEETSPAHAAADLRQANITSALTTGDVDVAQTSPDQDRYPDGPFEPAHHCCAAHTGGIAPATHDATLLVQASLRVPVPLSVGGAPLTAPEGLDRPPKPIAIA